MLHSCTHFISACGTRRTQRILRPFRVAALPDSVLSPDRRIMASVSRCRCPNGGGATAAPKHMANTDRDGGGDDGGALTEATA